MAARAARGCPNQVLPGFVQGLGDFHFCEHVSCECYRVPEPWVLQRFWRPPAWRSYMFCSVKVPSGV